MSYVLTVIHPPVAPAVYGKAEVSEARSLVQYAADLAGQMLIDGGVRTLPARFFANHLANEPFGMPYVHDDTGLAFRIDPADNAPHPCPCCSRAVFPGDHADAHMDDAYCTGCFTWNRGDVQCLPANTAHTEYPEGTISPERWEKLLDRVDAQLADDDLKEP